MKQNQAKSLKLQTSRIEKVKSTGLVPLRHPQCPLSLWLPLSGHIYSDRLSDQLRGNWYLTLQKEKAIESEENSRIVSLKTLLSLEQGERSGESNRNGSSLWRGNTSGESCPSSFLQIQSLHAKQGRKS